MRTIKDNRDGVAFKPDWRPVLAIGNSRAFGAIRGVAMASPARRETIVEGLVRFGFGADGVFRVEVAVKP